MMKSLQSIFNDMSLVLTNPIHQRQFVERCVKEGYATQEVEDWVNNAQATYINNGGGYDDAEIPPIRMLVGFIGWLGIGLLKMLFWFGLGFLIMAWIVG